MKRRSSRRRFAIVLVAACGIPAAHACAPARITDRYEQSTGAHDQWARFAASAPKFAARNSTNIPTTIIGSYGDTVLDLLSGGNVVLVKWPDDSPHQKWNGRWHGAPVDSEAGGAHIFFLWPDS